MIRRDLTRQVKNLELLIEKMASEKNFEKFQDQWEMFLLRLEKLWNYLRNNLKNRPGYEAWVQPIRAKRQTDSVLCYLHQARNAENHGIGGSIDRTVAISLREQYGRDFSISKADVTFENGVLTFDLQSNLIGREIEADILPSDPVLKPITNRNKTFHPPLAFVSQNLKPLHPVLAAKIGLAYYRGCVESAVMTFELV